MQVRLLSSRLAPVQLADTRTAAVQLGSVSGHATRKGPNLITRANRIIRQGLFTAARGNPGLFQPRRNCAVLVSKGGEASGGALDGDDTTKKEVSQDPEKRSIDDEVKRRVDAVIDWYVNEEFKRRVKKGVNRRVDQEIKKLEDEECKKFEDDDRLTRLENEVLEARQKPQMQFKIEDVRDEISRCNREQDQIQEKLWKIQQAKTKRVKDKELRQDANRLHSLKMLLNARGASESKPMPVDDDAYANEGDNEYERNLEIDRRVDEEVKRRVDEEIMKRLDEVKKLVDEEFVKFEDHELRRLEDEVLETWEKPQMQLKLKEVHDETDRYWRKIDHIEMERERIQEAIKRVMDKQMESLSAKETRLAWEDNTLYHVLKELRHLQELMELQSASEPKPESESEPRAVSEV